MRRVPARRHTGPRHPVSWRAAAIRRLWPAGLTSTAIAVCVLIAVALAGLIVIAVSMIVVATGQAGVTLAQVLEACSGELALLALTVSVVLGVAAAERHLLSPGARVTAQIAHRAVALTAFGFLVLHILLETVAGRAAPVAAVLPFISARGRLYLGLGTIASDLLIAVIATSLARMRYSQSAHPQLWRAVHGSIYVAWPLAILHGILMRGVPVWAAWTYGICAAMVALAIAARIRMHGPLPQAPANAMRELTPALPSGVAALGNTRQIGAGPGTVAAGPGTHAPRPGTHVRPAHRPRTVARRLPGYQPEHPEPPQYHRARPSRSARDPRPASHPAPGSAPPWPPARHPAELNEPQRRISPNGRAAR